MGVVNAHHPSSLFGLGHLSPQQPFGYVGELNCLHKPHQYLIAFRLHHLKEAVVGGYIPIAGIQLPCRHGDHVPGIIAEGEVASIPSFFGQCRGGQAKEN